MRRSGKADGVLRHHSGDVEGLDAAADVRDHEEDVQGPECEGRHGEEVCRPDPVAMVPEERASALGGWPPARLQPVAAHGLRTHVVPERPQLGPDAHGPPARVLLSQAPDQGPSLGGDPPAPRAAHATLPCPEPAPARPMPAHHRVRVEDDEGRAPARPARRRWPQRTRSLFVTRGRCAHIASWCRTARFSRSKSRRERPRRASTPRSTASTVRMRPSHPPGGSMGGHQHATSVAIRILWSHRVFRMPHGISGSTSRLNRSIAAIWPATPSPWAATSSVSWVTPSVSQRLISAITAAVLPARSPSLRGGPSNTRLVQTENPSDAGSRPAASASRRTAAQCSAAVAGGNEGRVEDVAIPHGAAERRPGRSADPDRDPVLDRLGGEAEGGKPGKAAREGGRLLREHRAEDLEGFIGPRAPTVGGHPQRLELLAHPAYPNAEDDPPAREHIQRNELFRGQQRGPVPENHDGGAQPNALGAARPGSTTARDSPATALPAGARAGRGRPRGAMDTGTPRRGESRGGRSPSTRRTPARPPPARDPSRACALPASRRPASGPQNPSVGRPIWLPRGLLPPTCVGGRHPARRLPVSGILARRAANGSPRRPSMIRREGAALNGAGRRWIRPPASFLPCAPATPTAWRHGHRRADDFAGRPQNRSTSKRS